MNRRFVLIVFICFVCFGCSSKKISDSVKFKNEYEKYNDKYMELEIDYDNIVKYANKNKINNIISEGTGVILIGSPRDNVCRKAVSLLLKVSDSTDLDTIYYNSNLDGISGLDDIGELNVPVVLFVLDGKIVKYKIGANEEDMDLYNIYLDGIHEVLQDTCDERC